MQYSGRKPPVTTEKPCTKRRCSCNDHGKNPLPSVTRFRNEVFEGLVTAKPTALKVACYFQNDKPEATYTDSLSRFQHTVELRAHENFYIKPLVLIEGPYAGQKAIVMLPAPTFAFEKLPAELRATIYQMVFWTGGTVRVARDFQGASPLRKEGRETASLLRTNRAIYKESFEALYSHQHFIFATIPCFNNFMQQIGEAKRLITRVTIERGGTQHSSALYQSLTKTPRLQGLTVTLPSTFKGTLQAHMDVQWQCIRLWLLGNGASLEESVRRVAMVTFRVGPAQTSVFQGDNVSPIKLITDEQNESCRKYLRKKLEKHFNGKA